MLLSSRFVHAAVVPEEGGREVEPNRRPRAGLVAWRTGLWTLTVAWLGRPLAMAWPWPDVLAALGVGVEVIALLFVTTIELHVASYCTKLLIMVQE